MATKSSLRSLDLDEFARRETVLSRTFSANRELQAEKGRT